MIDSTKLRLCVLLAFALTLVPIATAQAGTSSPKIRAKPHSVMVNTETTLKGRGFPANTTITLEECGRTFWIAPEDPCLDEGAKTVTTDAKGKFQTGFPVGLCPEGEATKKPTQRVCYVGELVTGEDTGSLVAPAKLIVTWP
jgi:hypothetical protein